MRVRMVVPLLLVLAACTASEPATTTLPETTATAAPAPTTATPVAAPEPRMGHAMVALGGGELLVFGGRSYRGNAEVFLDDTWILDVETFLWRKLEGEGPAARSQHAMAFDPKRRQVLLFGGYVGSSFTYGDTWLFDVASERWERLSPAVAPTARAGSVAVFDTAADAFVMFAGAEEPPAAELPLDETWLFRPDAMTWDKATPGLAPTLVSEGHPTLFELAMAYDSQLQQSVLLVAGESTWLFDASAGQWAAADGGASQGLGADYMTAAAYQPGVGTIAYGGAPVERTQGTWVFDGESDSWALVQGAVPGPLANHAMAYEPSSDAVYIFGGSAAVLVLDGVPPVTSELWRFGVEGWQQVGRP